jgi:hypothetical protein
MDELLAKEGNSTFHEFHSSAGHQELSPLHPSGSSFPTESLSGNIAVSRSSRTQPELPRITYSQKLVTQIPA